MIPETPPYNNYVGDGVTTQFDFDFYIENENPSQLVVKLIAADGTETELLYETDYSIHELGNPNGSYITYPLASSSHTVLAADETISLQLTLPIEQQSEYGTSSELDLESVEYSFDYLTRIAQIQNRQLERAIKVQEGTSIDTELLVKEVNVIYNNIDNINAVNNNAANINTVSGNTSNINTVSGSIANVNTVGNDIENVNSVAGDLANIDAVEADLTNIDTAASNIANVNTVASNISAVNNVSSNTITINKVAEDLFGDNNIGTVAADIANVNAVAGDLTNIDAVKANKTNIDTVAGISNNVSTVAGIAANVSTVADVSANVVAVDTNKTNINTVATDIASVNAVAADLPNIDAASSNAALSKQYAIGYPTEPPEGSAKYWAAQSAQGQIQSDWEQEDTTKKDYIKNKPTLLSDFIDDTSANPIDKADTLTNLITPVSELNYVNGVTSSIQNQINNKANLIWYADREFEYKAPNFVQADKANVTIKAGTAIKLKSGEYYYTASDAVFAISSILDTGTVAAGKDYYFYMTNSKQLVASLSETAPSGYTESDVVKIGGAHTLCVGVTSGNAPTLLADSFWASHPAIGYNAGHFIPNSSWTPAFRSNAKTGNKGMALIDFYGFDKFWVDIYLQSGTGAATASTYSGTITNNRQCILHEQDMRMVGKSLPKDWQFSIFSEGSNQKTNIAGGAIPSGRLTGGYTDTAGKRMISGFFIECCCGYLWQWGDEIAPTGGSGWAQYGDDRRGGSYGMPYVLQFGGRYDDSTNCGSWSRGCNDTRTYAYASNGGRGVSLHIEKQHS